MAKGNVLPGRRFHVVGHLAKDPCTVVVTQAYLDGTCSPIAYIYKERFSKGIFKIISRAEETP